MIKDNKQLEVAQKTLVNIDDQLNSLYVGLQNISQTVPAKLNDGTDNPYYEEPIVDPNLNFPYNAPEGTILDKDELINIQNQIDFFKRLRLEIYNDIVRYTFTQQPSSQDNVYTTRIGVLITDIAQLFYGDFEYWQYIYDYNQLTDVLLETGVELEIPALPDEPERVLHITEVLRGAYIKRLIEVGELNI